MNYLAIYLVFLPFAIIAALMAYLITYSEWAYHYPTKKEPRKHALEMAIFTLIFFAVLTAFVVYLLSNFVER